MSVSDLRSMPIGPPPRKVQVRPGSSWTHRRWGLLALGIPALIVALGYVFFQRERDTLAARGVPVTGQIVAVVTGTRGSNKITYRYTASGQTLEGTEANCEPGARPGGTVELVYLPGRPQSCMPVLTSRSQASGYFASLVAAFILFACITCFWILEARLVWRALALGRDGLTAPVAAVEHMTSGGVRYRFTVDGKEITGEGAVNLLSKNSLTAGVTLVFFDPRDPSRNMLAPLVEEFVITDHSPG